MQDPNQNIKKGNDNWLLTQNKDNEQKNNYKQNSTIREKRTNYMDRISG